MEKDLRPSLNQHPATIHGFSAFTTVRIFQGLGEKAPFLIAATALLTGFLGARLSACRFWVPVCVPLWCVWRMSLRPSLPSLSSLHSLCRPRLL